MAFRRIAIPALDRTLSNIMVDPSSAEHEPLDLALDEYLRLDGNCIHLHDEGDGDYSRRATGQWLERRNIRAELFLCTQICHAGWDSVGQRAIDRFTAEAVGDDISIDLELLATKYVDLVYVDDNPRSPVEPVIEALCREIARGRIKGFGFRNWTAERIDKAHAHLSRKGLPRVAVVITTELALAASTAPLWPEYVPFDTLLASAVNHLGLGVFAHAADINLGQCLYEYEDATPIVRHHWFQRWDFTPNKPLIRRVRHFADALRTTPRTVNVAWVLNQPFPCIAIVPLSSFGAGRGAEYECASQLILQKSDLNLLKPIF